MISRIRRRREINSLRRIYGENILEKGASFRVTFPSEYGPNKTDFVKYLAIVIDRAPQKDIVFDFREMSSFSYCPALIASIMVTYPSRRVFFENVSETAQHKFELDSLESLLDSTAKKVA